MKAPQTPSEQARAIARSAEFLARQIESGSLPPKYRRRAETRLRKALAALASPKWKLATVQRSVLLVLGLRADSLRRGVITEEVAAQRLLDGLAGVFRDVDMPEHLRGARCSRATAFACLRAWARTAGAPPRGTLSKYSAAHALFAELGIASGTAPAIKQLVLRASRARRSLPNR